MKRKDRIYPTNMLIRSVVFVFFTWFAWRYKIRKKMPAEVRKLKPPYLVLGNHVGFWDPFVAGNFLPHYVHYVSSDAAFRNPLFRFFLTRLGTIPKKKNIRDTKVIRDIIGVLRQGENVGIFPEAVRNWAGRSFPLDPSIVKMIRMAGVPVVVPILKGMNLFNPRWSKKLRKGRMEVEYTLLFTKEDVQTLEQDVLYEKLSRAIYHDEVDYQRQQMIPFKSATKAEHISYALYVCPACHGIDTFLCSGNTFRCSTCGYDLEIDLYGFFKRISEGELYFDNIRDWYYWEEKFLTDQVNQYLSNPSGEAILVDRQSFVYQEDGGGEMVLISQGDVALYDQRIVIDLTNGQQLVLNLDDLQTINPQVHERLEIFYQNTAYRIVGVRDGISALKWEVAVNAIWRAQGQKHKLSPYIQPEK